MSEGRIQWGHQLHEAEGVVWDTPVKFDPIGEIMIELLIIARQYL